MKSKISALGGVTASLLMVPFVTEAAGIVGLIDRVGTVINALLPLLMMAATVVFFYGLINYLVKDGDKKDSLHYMVMGIVTLFVMASIWGLVAFLQSSLGINSDGDKGLHAPKSLCPGGKCGSRGTSGSAYRAI